MIDQDGFPGTRGEDGQFDGGDTAAIVGNCIALRDSHLDWPKLLYSRELLIKPDAPVRHPDYSRWWGRPDRFSRDQLIPILCSYVENYSHGSARLLFRLHRKRLFLTAWNTRKNGAIDVPEKSPDFTGPEIWALWIRIFQPWWGIIILPILDIETLIGSITWKFRKSRVTRNHMLVCLTGRRRFFNLTMRLAFWLNDWDTLIERWRAHCQAVGEYQTAVLFKNKLEEK